MSLKYQLKFKKTVIGVIFFLLLGSAFAQEPSFTISISETQGNPGDNIIVKYSADRGDASIYTIERLYVDLDGIHQYAERWGNISTTDWQGANFSNNWTATTGFHTLAVTFNWYETALGKTETHYNTKIINIQISGWEKQGGYKHPGLLSSSEELDVVRNNVTTKPDHPMSFAYENLLTLRMTRKFLDGSSSFIYLSKLDYDSAPIDTVHFQLKNHKVYSTYHERDIMDYAGTSAYSHALQWVITKKQEHADKAIDILNKWATKCKTTNFGIYASLHATNSLGNWLEAAEILRHYKINGQGSGWSEANIQKYNTYVRRVFYPLAMSWQGNIGNPWETQNQPDYVAYARMNLGIYMDDEAMYQSGYDHFFDRKLYGNKSGYKDWDGNRHTYIDLFGRKPISLFELTIAPDGTYMEVNRDGGHMSMCKVATYKIAELLWHQGIDMYDMKIHNDQIPRLVKGVDWLYTHSNEVPFWNQRRGNEDGPGQITMGKFLKGLAIHEMVYNHYKHRLKDKYAITSLNDVTVSGRNGYTDKNGTFRMMGPGAANYTATNIFAVLTHADVSKDIVNGVDNINEDGFSVYPNPTSDIINVVGKEMEKVMVYNLLGGIVKTYAVNNNKLEIDLANQPPGIYFIKIISGNNQLVKQVVKE